MSHEPASPAAKAGGRPVDPETLPYRPCVGVVVVNRQGLVWCGRRLVVPSGEMDGALNLWQMPQGGIDAGEDAEIAARRELYEETGIRSVTLIGEAPDWITYELPPELVGIALKGRFRGQKQRWFAYRFEGEESEIAIDPPPEGHSAEFDAYAWKPMAEVVDLVVPFKRGVYEAVARAFGPLVQAD